MYVCVGGMGGREMERGGTEESVRVGGGAGGEEWRQEIGFWVEGVGGERRRRRKRRRPV